MAILTGLTGVGILGVGVFPGNYGTIHALFALLIFSAGGLAAIVSRTVQTPPFSVRLDHPGRDLAGYALVLYMILGDSSSYGRPRHWAGSSGGSPTRSSSGPCLSGAI